MKDNSRYMVLPLVLLLGLLLTLQGCGREEPHYGHSEEVAKINIFYASDLMAKRDYRRIYLNDSIPEGNIKNFPILPNYTQEFPRYVSQDTSGGTLSGWSHGTQGFIYYMPIGAGEQKLIFTNGADMSVQNAYQHPSAKIYIKDTLLTLQPASYTNIYLADGVENGTFTVVATKEESTLPEERGKTHLRILHLSPDVGPLLIQRAYDDGRREAISGVPEQMGYAQYTEYLTFPTEGLDAEMGNIILSFSTPSDPDVPLLTAAVPAIDGAIHTVVVHGFRHPTVRSIVDEYDSFVGLPLQREYEISAALRTTIRRGR